MIKINWCIQHFNALSAVIGLVFDIIGAWLVASEVVKQYRGKKYAPVIIPQLNNIDSNEPTEVFDHPDYEIAEKKKYLFMKWGLGFLTLGFILQIIPSFLQLFNP